MRFPILTLALATAALTAAPARAELDDAGHQVESDLRDFQSAVVAGKESGDRVAHYFSKSPDECDAAIARGKQLGISPSEVMQGNPDAFLFKRAGATCDAYRTWKRVIEGAVALADAKSRFGIAQTMKPGEVTGEWANQYGAVGAKCLADLDAMKGLALDVPVSIGGGEPETLAAARTTYCQGLVDWAKGFAVATDKVRADALAALRGKYTKFGIKGDRLKLLMELDDYTLYGRGCNSTVDDIPARKKAAVLVYFTELANGGTGIRRYDFRGDKLVRETYHEVALRESAYRFCK